MNDKGKWASLQNNIVIGISSKISVVFMHYARTFPA